MTQTPAVLAKKLCVLRQRWDTRAPAMSTIPPRIMAIDPGSGVLKLELSTLSWSLIL